MESQLLVTVQPGKDSEGPLILPSMSFEAIAKKALKTPVFLTMISTTPASIIYLEIVSLGEKRYSYHHNEQPVALWTKSISSSFQKKFRTNIFRMMMVSDQLSETKILLERKLNRNEEQQEAIHQVHRNEYQNLKKLWCFWCYERRNSKQVNDRIDECFEIGKNPNAVNSMLDHFVHQDVHISTWPTGTEFNLLEGEIEIDETMLFREKRLMWRGEDLRDETHLSGWSTLGKGEPNNF